MADDPAPDARRAAVETYFDGFRRSDHAQILALLTDDVIWDLPGASCDVFAFRGDLIARVESYAVPLPQS